MPSDRITAILRSKGVLSDNEISDMSEGEAWQWLYRNYPPKSGKYRKKENEICFTGFPAALRQELENEAEAANLDIVKSVTKSLRYLVAGPNAGPSKLAKAKEKEVVIMTQDQFHNMLETGELPI